MPDPKSWLLLVLTLPTENATARMRFWRALKAMGCAVLRDGVYLLPATPAHDEALGELAESIIAAGGNAAVLECASRNAAQDALFRGLFDRSEDYAEFGRSLREARQSLSKQSVPELNRLVRRLRREYEALRATDHFPGEAAVRAEAGWSDFIGAAEQLLSPDEPRAVDAAIVRLERNDYQGRTWATRRQLWVDRVASAWLIRRFIDSKARFLWLAKPADCPKKALGFDFDGATFSHVGERVTFEVLLASFGLEKDLGLARLAELVHALDVGGAAVAEAGGFEAMMSGARQRAANDDALLAEMSGMLDSLYAYYSGSAAKEKRR